MSALATAVFVALFAAAAVIGVGITLVRAVRVLHERRRARRAAQPRRALLAVAAGERGAELAALVRLRGGDWKAVEPTAFELLAKVRGEAHAALAEVFARRGVVRRAREQLRRPGAVRRARAAGVLGSLGDRAAVPDLCRLLADPHSDVRVAAIHALGRIGDPAAAGALLASLTGPGPAPAQLVAHALIRLGQSAVPALVPALGDAAPLVRATALDALRLLGATSAEQPVGAVLAHDPAPAVRLRAAATLGRIGTRAAVPRLLAACEPNQPTTVRAAAARALGELGVAAAVPPLRALLASPEYRIANEAAAALLLLEPAGATALAEAAAGTDSAATHAREALALAELAAHTVPRRPAEAHAGA
jgi:HEAT repeat protein